MYWMFPGYPGPVNPRMGLADVALPTLPSHPGGIGMAGASPLEGVAAYGVPVARTAAGRPVLACGVHPAASMQPPEVQGMPAMPPFPEPGFGGGLFQPIAPVEPFDPGNQVRQLQQQAYGQE